jgi:hypothetical protein
MQLLITPLAAFDLEEIGDNIAQDNPVRAGSFAPEVSWLSCVRLAKRFVSTLLAIRGSPNCLMTCAHARMATK